MGFFNRPGRGADAAATREREQVDTIIERVLQLHPQLRLARRYRQQLAPAVAGALAYARGLIDAVPAAREASAAAWADDPYIHAWFAAPDDVAAALSRSAALRACFLRHGDATQAYAVLGMAMSERHILGVAQEGETLRREVPQTTLSFSDHQVRLCERGEAELRAEIVLRLLDQLALTGLAHSAADKSHRDALERERALLKTRLQLLERQGTGIRTVLGSEATADSGELAHLADQLQENARGLADLGQREDALERALEHVRAVFAQPQQYLSVSTRRVRLDRMNVLLAPDSPCAGADLDLRIARVPGVQGMPGVPGVPPRERAFSLVRFARAELLPEKSMFEEAAQQLASGSWS
jgi:hypothetical protein